MIRRFTRPLAGRRFVASVLGCVAIAGFYACAGESTSNERNHGDTAARGGTEPTAGRSGSGGAAAESTGGSISGGNAGTTATGGAPTGGVAGAGGIAGGGGSGAIAGQSGAGGAAAAAGEGGAGGEGGEGTPTCPGDPPRCGAICCPDNRWHCDDFAGPATCDVEPGCVGAPPTCFEGSVCCPDGTWECRDGPLCIGRM